MAEIQLVGRGGANFPINYRCELRECREYLGSCFGLYFDGDHSSPAEKRFSLLLSTMFCSLTFAGGCRALLNPSERIIACPLLFTHVRPQPGLSWGLRLGFAIATR